MNNSCLRVVGTLICLFLFTCPQYSHAQDIVSVINQYEELNTFANALKSSSLDETLNDEGPYTIFAPSDPYLEKAISNQSLSSPAVKKMLLNHIITGHATERNMNVMSKTTSLGGITLVMKEKNGQIYVNDIGIVTYNIKAKNGIIHILGGVLK